MQALKDASNSICDELEEKDANDGSFKKDFNEGGPDYVQISVEWAVNPPQKPSRDDCRTRLYTISDACDGNDFKYNPKNWKHGGIHRQGDTRYTVTPLRPRYQPGICKVGMNMLKRHKSEYTIWANVTDAGEKIIGSSPRNEQGEETDSKRKSAWVLPDKLYATFSVRPDGDKDGDFVQFNLGDQTWTTRDTNLSVIPNCAMEDLKYEDREAKGLGGLFDKHSESKRGSAIFRIDCSFYC